MISEKDYNEIHLKGYEDGKNDNNNLKIHYEIKPSFTTRKIKELQQENKHLDEVNCKLRRKIGQLEDNWNKLRKWIVYNKHNENTEQHYLVVDYGTLLGKMQELRQGSDSNAKD